MIKKTDRQYIPQPLLTTSKLLGHNIKWDHFDILAKGKTDCHCKIKETLYLLSLFLICFSEISWLLSLWHMPSWYHGTNPAQD